MNLYLSVKLLHIVSATLLFGTGLGTAFFMLQAYRSGNLPVLRATSRHVVQADWAFTTPAVVVQLVTGLWLTSRLGIPFDSAWFVAVAGLFLTVGACWLPVVCIQLRICRMLAAAPDAAGLPAACRRLMRIWTVLGIAAFTAVLMLFVLMVFRPGTAERLFA